MYNSDKRQIHINVKSASRSKYLKKIQTTTNSQLQAIIYVVKMRLIAVQQSTQACKEYCKHHVSNNEHSMDCMNGLVIGSINENLGANGWNAVVNTSYHHIVSMKCSRQCRFINQMINVFLSKHSY